MSPRASRSRTGRPPARAITFTPVLSAAPLRRSCRRRRPSRRVSLPKSPLRDSSAVALVDPVQHERRLGAGGELGEQRRRADPDLGDRPAPGTIHAKSCDGPEYVICTCISTSPRSRSMPNTMRSAACSTGRARVAEETPAGVARGSTKAGRGGRASWELRGCGTVRQQTAYQLSRSACHRALPESGRDRHTPIAAPVSRRLDAPHYPAWAGAPPRAPRSCRRRG